MFLVVLAVSDPLLLSVAALSTGAHSPRVYLIGGISGLSGNKPHYLEATCPLNTKRKEKKEKFWYGSFTITDILAAISHATVQFVQ